MQTKPFLLAAALITFPAASAFAQASQPAPMQNTAPAPAPAPDAAPPSSPSDNAPAGSTAPAPAATTAAAPATLTDLKVNAVVYDVAGAKVGTIQSATTTGAVVSTGTARAEIPLASFTKTPQGIAIGITKTQFEAAIAKATAAKS